ncbi:EAL domain-containing protein [Paenalcaligenes sp. Me52]|uniref:EAL domain-containing protein n=1 Tax=Paenalcaligenes sp. Me52 TaxID=3392038 RepID=UPI003D2DCB6B
MHRYKAALIRMTMLGLGAIVPSLLFAMLSWQFSLYSEEQRLRSVDHLIVMRTEDTLRAAEDALKALSAYQVEPCSPLHLERMRQVAVNSPAIQEVAYTMPDGKKCVLWGQVNVFMGIQDVSFGTPGGLEVTAGIELSELEAERVLLLRYGNYEAMVREWRFMDMYLTRPALLALATTDGTLVAASAAFPQELLTQVFSVENGAQWQDKRYITVMERYGNWLAVAMVPRQGFLSYIQENRESMMPTILMLTMLSLLLTLYLMLKPRSLTAALRLALRRREMEVYYQPIMHLETGACVGAEALMRWKRGDGSWISPEEFVPAAEKSGQIIELTNLLVDRVVVEAGDFLVLDRNLHISLNLSSHDVRSGRILPVLRESFLEQGVKAEQLWLEITERVSMDIEAARDTLNTARDDGFVVAIDDFGTGYSSLQYLQSLPVDVLKIDKAFIHSIGTGAASSAVVLHIIKMAQSLGLVMVAEGVETQEQADYLRANGVDFVQGWLYSKALCWSDFVAFYKRHQTTGGTTPWPKEYDYHPPRPKSQSQPDVSAGHMIEAAGE